MHAFHTPRIQKCAFIRHDRNINLTFSTWRWKDCLFVEIKINIVCVALTSFIIWSNRFSRIVETICRGTPWTAHTKNNNNNRNGYRFCSNVNVAKMGIKINTTANTTHIYKHNKTPNIIKIINLWSKRVTTINLCMRNVDMKRKKNPQNWNKKNNNRNKSECIVWYKFSRRRGPLNMCVQRAQKLNSNWWC